jgi:medium-chain acyl-[acyl-carrier-protein] hydrolase
VSWISLPKKNANSAVRLFCFHHAGSGGASFRDWPKLLPSSIEVATIHLPGREGRFGEPCFRRMTDLVSALVPEITPYLDRPFATFGHSMGSLVSYDLVRELRARGLPQPLYFFASGRKAPGIAKPGSHFHELPDELFLRAISMRYLGVPEAIRKDKKLMEIFVPILKADIEVIETYEYTPQTPFNFPVSAFGGKQDVELGEEGLSGWSAITNDTFKKQMFEGDHFYLFGNEASRASLLQSIAEDLAERT